MLVEKIIIMGLFVFIVGTFHWLRLFAMVAGLCAWGAGTVGVSLYLLADRLADGAVLGAMLVVAATIVPVLLWSLSARYAYQWLMREHAAGRVMLPWYSR